MLRRMLFGVVLFVCAAVTPSVSRAGENGFVIGIEGGYATWGLDGSKITLKDSPVDGIAQPGVSFVQPINDKSNYAFNLHLGWNILGHASVEAAIHATSWDLFNTNRGGAGFVGGRATWWPMQIFLPKDRKYDAGIEFGAGYSIAGGTTYEGLSLGMDGPYVQFGLTGEYRVSPVLGFAAHIRHFAPYWNKFYVDFDNNLGSSATAPSGGWTTFTVGINLHVPVGGSSDGK